MVAAQPLSRMELAAPQGQEIGYQEPWLIDCHKLDLYLQIMRGHRIPQLGHHPSLILVADGRLITRSLTGHNGCTSRYLLILVFLKGNPFVQILLLTYDLEFLPFFMTWEKACTQHSRWKFVHAMHGIGALGMVLCSFFIHIIPSLLSQDVDSLLIELVFDSYVI